MELTWLFVILIIVGGLTVLLLLSKHKFTDIESFAGFKDDQLSFADKQYTYYHDKLGKEILVNPGIDVDKFYSSVLQPGTLIPEPLKNSLSKRFQRDPYNKFTDRDIKFCKNAKTPASLPPRPKKATTGCGWWFVYAPDKSSSGALGSREKPFFPNTLPREGEWIWDVKTATKKEEIKRCMQIKNCNLIDLKGVKGFCGFCPDKGVAVPINSNQQEKYPEDTMCATEVVLTKSQCPVPKPKPIETPEGVSCGEYGSPSSDGRIREYTKDECASVDPMARHENGECLKPNGGSYSWDCRFLNRPAVKTNTICEPDASGKLTRPCLLSLCQGMGYTRAGTIVKKLMNPAMILSEMDTMAIQIMGSIGVSVPDAVLGAGDIDAESASDVYYNIMSTANSSSSELYKGAAAWLTYGSDGFDPCSVADNTIGPFVPQCIQREYRKAGCQPAGSEYPGSDDKLGKFAGYSWGDVKREFSALFNDMSNGNGDEQDKAVSKCLGIGIKREPPSAKDCGKKLSGVFRRVIDDFQMHITWNGNGYTIYYTKSEQPTWTNISPTISFDENNSKGVLYEHWVGTNMTNSFLFTLKDDTITIPHNPDYKRIRR